METLLEINVSELNLSLHPQIHKSDNSLKKLACLVTDWSSRNYAIGFHFWTLLSLGVSSIKFVAVSTDLMSY